jgi:hypothetical protein
MYKLNFIPKPEKDTQEKKTVGQFPYEHMQNTSIKNLETKFTNTLKRSYTAGGVAQVIRAPP